MGKKRLRKSYKSKGQRRNVSTANLRQDVSFVQSMLHKVEAWKAGKKGYVTMENPNKSETNRRFIRVTLNSYFGGAYKDVRWKTRSSTNTDNIEIAA